MSGARPPRRGSPAYRENLDFLYRQRRFGMRPGLEVIRELLGALGHPERSFRSVHVTGSKGKGSVCAMTAGILLSAGLRVGLYTSPHLVSYRERIRVDGRPIPRAGVAEGLARLRGAAADLLSEGRIDREPTFFEYTTALALGWFRDRRIDAAVVEVGIGGRLDATNVLDAAVGVITTVELEHTDILGTSLSAIAREKAGILHTGMRGIVGELPAEALDAVRRQADACGVPLYRLGAELAIGPRALAPSGQRVELGAPGRPPVTVRLPLAGRFQAENAALAVEAARELARALGRPLSDAAVRRGLARLLWRGRLERLAGRSAFFLDVAHTPGSARAIAEGLAELRPFNDASESVLLFGCLSDKRADEILDALAPLAETVVVVPVRSARTADPKSLARAAQGRFRRIVSAPSVVGGFALARACVGPDGLLLATGSDYLVGEILALREGGAEEEPELSDPGRVGPATELPAAG